jgi:hypothetical protein
LQHLAPGRETKLRVGPIRALPMRPVVVANPKVTAGEKSIEFPVQLAPGSWIECNSPQDCAVYGAKGEPLGNVTPRGDWPVICGGSSPLRFSCESGGELKPRARVTVFCSGEEL